MKEGEQFSLIPEFKKAEQEKVARQIKDQAEDALDREEEERLIQETLNREVWEAELKDLEIEEEAEAIAAKEKETQNIYEREDPWEDINSPITNEILRSRKKKNR